LTIIGYSVNDTIVVFDRVRENINKGISRDFETTVNVSLTEVLGRSLNTSLTTFIVLLALALLGGVTIRSLVIVLIIGIISGTYSSIFIASQVLVVWEEGGFKKFFSRIPVPGLARGK
jgi:preprotein translocase subunit SecF